MTAPVLDQGDRVARLETYIAHALAIIESGDQLPTRMCGWARDVRGQYLRGDLPRAACSEPACQKPIVWGITREGQQQPLDPRPACYAVLESGLPGGVLVARAKLVLVSHFATCKNPHRFSRHGGGR